jgi:tRNA(Arg) A34 adenosine deaminase TadA
MEPHLKLAVEVAEMSPSRKKVGAVLYNSKRRVITTAVNNDYKSHPRQAWWAQRVGLGEKIYLHAEMACLIKAREAADTIVVVRLGGHDGKSLRQSRPCPVCEPALRYAGIKHVYYSVTNKFSYEYWG